MHKKATNNYFPSLDGVRFFGSVVLIIAHTTAAVAQIPVSDPQKIQQVQNKLRVLCTK